MDIIDFVLNNPGEVPYKLDPLNRRSLEELFKIERKLNKRMGSVYSKRQMYGLLSEYKGKLKDKEKQVTDLIKSYGNL